MKSTYQHLVFVVTLLALSASAYAQSPREQLNQMLEQLQKAPNDDLLRERIIKLGAELKPSPAISDVALNHEGRGISAFKTATDVEDYIAAAREFEAASLAAPWVAGYYSDMCTAYEKGGAFQEAASSCRLYSLAVTDEREIREAKIRAAGMPRSHSSATTSIAIAGACRCGPRATA